MAAEGADLIDVGGESTRPGADRVAAEEEARRVLPVIGELAAAGLAVSVDTYRAAVAERRWPPAPGSSTTSPAAWATRTWPGWCATPAARGS